MEITILNDLITHCVPRNTYAPWLAPKSTKVMTVYPYVFHVKSRKYRVDETIVVPAGYVFDWASIPRLAWLLYPPNFSEARKGAAAHDYLYSHLFQHFPKAFADDVLLAFMRYEHASKISQTIFHLSVRWGGQGGWYHSRQQNADPFWRIYREKIPYDFSGEVSPSPFAHLQPF